MGNWVGDAADVTYENETMKRCTMCGRFRALSEFSRTNRTYYRDGRVNECKSCASERGKEYRTRKAEQIREKKKLWREANREHIRKYWNANRRKKRFEAVVLAESDVWKEQQEP